MIANEILAIAKQEKTIDNKLVEIPICNGDKLSIYPNSIKEADDVLLFIAKLNNKKSLFILGENSKVNNIHGLTGEEICQEDSNILKKCVMNTENRITLQKMFDYLVSITLGIEDSFGFGDRLGVANVGHIKSVKGSKFKAILAQQSIRELTRTKRTPEEVMDAAVYAVFQEGYEEGFGSDADHLKTTEDIDLMVNAGYTMFTFDPGDCVDNDADEDSENVINEKFGNLPWNELYDSQESVLEKYVDTEFNISDDLVIKPSKQDLVKAYVKYGKAVLHVKKLHDHLKYRYSHMPTEIEISVDETESVTTPFEHFFIINELMRLNVQFVSIAPRFIGDFEKGIDYKGDLDLFKAEYEKHIAITKYFGSYKISLHSGSDKFDVYRVIGTLDNAYTHVKTAGTSYLEALRVIAEVEPKFFSEIYDYCFDLYDIEKKTYHVSADISTLKKSTEYSNEELKGLLDNDHARQVLHVTFGRVLTDQDENGKYLFKDRLLDMLRDNEDVYNNFLFKHFRNHIEPFGK